ncbi:hypothetical protein TELCIR_14804 [Teladorsagia circumcincta]|uniref:Uncharacterized protein n=1 Tax=Teladorsagia circumcincta TaxID=45464 RepID=A0A2G9U085_TELCI|nr:hypothetical protein TELCIR_14804 [Teladorsagia circumcincta]
MTNAVAISVLLICFSTLHSPIDVAKVRWYLHGVLAKNEKVVETNRKILVEALRAIAEILIWGDQNDSSVFE